MALRRINRVWRRFQPPLIRYNYKAVGVFAADEPRRKLYEVKVGDREEALKQSRRVTTQIGKGTAHSHNF